MAATTGGGQPQPDWHGLHNAEPSRPTVGPDTPSGVSGASPLGCRCGKWGARCSARATQEDMLCDTCRAGCAWMRLYPAGMTAEKIAAGEPPGSDSHVLLELTGVVYTVPARFL